MPPLLDAPELVGALVRLEPLSTDHVEDLIVASSDDRSSYDFTTVPHGPDSVRHFVSARLDEAAAGQWVPFAQVRVADGRAVGVTNFATLRWQREAAAPYAVEIGGTWLAPSAQRSGINAEAKLLLLTHAFEVWHVSRVDFKTDERNRRSREAILAVGARFEGVLRSWQPSHAKGEAGRLRNSPIYSIVASEWPGVRERLVARLAAHSSR